MKHIKNFICFPFALITITPFIFYYILNVKGVSEFLVDKELRRDDLVLEILEEYLKVFPKKHHVILGILTWLIIGVYIYL